MYELLALDMVRLERAELERKAEKARLVREARPQKKLRLGTQGR